MIEHNKEVYLFQLNIACLITITLQTNIYNKYSLHPLQNEMFYWSLPEVTGYLLTHSPSFVETTPQ